MTRFARAKGSKASNERTFSDPTPWHEMKNDMLKKKQEIEEEKKRREAEARRNENYQKFLKDREKEAESRTVWAEFPEDNNTKVNGLSKKSKTIKKQKNKLTDEKLKKRAAQCLAGNTDKMVSDEVSQQAERSGSDDENSTVVNNLKRKKLKIIEAIDSNVLEDEPDKKKCKNTKLSLQEDASVQDQNENMEENDDDAPVELSSKVEIKKPVVKKVKKIKKKIVILNNDSLNPEEQEKPKKGKKIKNVDKDMQETGIQENITEENEIKTCKQKRKVIDLDSLPEAARKKILKKQEKRSKQVEKKKLKKKEKKEVENPDTNEVKNPETNGKPKTKTFGKSKSAEKLNQSKPSNEAPKQQKEKPKKQRLENGDVKRRKDFQPNKIMVNGNEIELEYFDGFPIKKEDAWNLRKLKKEMISKGLPRSEINRTLKLERRKAEKALAREKKKVCFNCRKFGHNLSECPNLSDKNELVEMNGAGVCFKCGASDHTSFACRVVKGPNFKYASCFICKEQGHISRQCPDNIRGLYPKGGSCRVCGDVTHLKKDCPQFQEQQKKEEAKFQVEAMFDGNPDDLAPQNEVHKPIVPETSKPKIIKF